MSQLIQKPQINLRDLYCEEYIDYVELKLYYF